MHGYLLFHSIAEIFSVVIAFSIFAIAWNSRRRMEDDFLLVIGIAYLFTGSIDLIHALAYKGMGIFEPAGEINRASSLWVAARYLQSVTFLAAPLFFSRRLRVELYFIAYAAFTILIILSIMHYEVFPVCFVEGRGLTPFKKISEYSIAAIFAASAVLLRSKRRQLDPNVYTMILYSILAAIICELCFALYGTPYDIFNFAGHVFKVVSFYFMYRAIVETGIKKPSALIFRQLKEREAELLENRKTLSGVNKKLVEAQRLARLGSWDWDLIKNELSYSDEIFEILGVAKGELDVSFNGFLKTVHPDDIKYVSTTINDAIAAIKPYEIEFRVTMPDGAEKYLHVRAEVFGDDAGAGIPGGNAFKISGTAQDVTERKLHENKIEEYNVLLKKTLSSLNEAVFIVDPKTRIIHECNETAEKIFGYTRDELIGNTTDILHVNEEAYREFGRMLNESFDSCKNLETEYRMKRKNGEIFASEHLVTPYEQIWGGGGGSHMVISVVRDISERKKNEAMLAESEERYRSIISGTQAVMLLIDPETLDIVEANNAACAYYGYSMEKLVSMKISNINMLSEAEVFLKAKEAKSRRQNYFNFHHRLSSGEVRDVEVYNAPITVKGKTYLFSIIHDISERNKLQRQLTELNVDLQNRVDEEVEKNRLRDQMMFEQSRHIAMGELLINIAHQWRQPLNSVAIVAQDIRDASRHGELDAKYLDKAVESLLSEVSSLSNTIEWFRSFQETEEEKISFCAAEAVDRSLSFMGEYFKTKNVTLDVIMDPKIKILGRPAEFSQAVLNILTNSKDVFEGRDVENGIIKVRLFGSSQDEPATLVISDNGGGIRQDIMEKIFDLYFTTKHKTRGTGLGLYMSRVIIEHSFKGALRVRNIDGWAEFTIEV